MEGEITDLELAYELIDDWVNAGLPDEPLELHGLELPYLPDLPPALKCIAISRCTFAQPLKIPKHIKILTLRYVPCVNHETFHDELVDVELEGLNPFEFKSLAPTLTMLVIENVPMKTLPPLPQGLKFLSLKCILVTNLPQLPPKLSYLRVMECNIEFLPSLPSSLKTLNCDKTWIKTLPPLPQQLRDLSCQGCLVEHLPDLPQALKELDCSKTPLKELPKLPPNLKELYCGYTQIESLPQLPKSLKILSSYSCSKLQNLPALPNGLEELYVDSTPIGYLTFPASLTQLDCQWCPNLPVKRDEKDSIEDYKQRWIDYEKSMAHNVCLTVKEELMMNRWHPDRVLHLLEAGVDVEDM